MNVGPAAPSRLAAVSTAIVFVLALAWAPAHSSAAAVPEPHADQWWIDVLDIDQVWDRHTEGEGVVVAVLDSGVEQTGDLEGAVEPGFSMPGGAGRGDDDIDPDKHGTSIAEAIAGRGTGHGIVGVAPRATILPIQIELGSEVRHAADALLRLAEMEDPPEIVNMSFGGFNGQCGVALQRAVREAVDRGMILVASMGNERTGREAPQQPASCPGVIAVGAYGLTSRGGTGDASDLQIWENSEQQNYTALAAPGLDIVSFQPNGQPVYYNGTSGAAAMVSGSLALVRAAYPDMSSRDVVARVLATAQHPGAPQVTWDEAWGFGSVRPLEAIEADLPTDLGNPVYERLDDASPPTQSPESTADASEAGDGAAEPSSSPAAADSDDGVSVMALVLALVGGVAVLGVIVAVFLLLRRRSGSARSVG